MVGEKKEGGLGTPFLSHEKERRLGSAQQKSARSPVAGQIDLLV